MLSTSVVYLLWQVPTGFGFFDRHAVEMCRFLDQNLSIGQSRGFPIVVDKY